MTEVRHVEFFHKKHFEENYFRSSPPASLQHFVDFFWETKFDGLWKDHPNGFSDALFPNIGYTYLINLGTPFTMQVKDKKFKMKTDGFLPRNKAIECYHQPGNRIFGIKFRISPVLFEKKINFSEYREYVFPLSYLLDQAVIDKIKKATSFETRVKIATVYFEPLIKKYSGLFLPARVVSAIMNRFENKACRASINDLAAEHGISTRTLQRYFEKTTSISSKKALQILRIRKAASHLANSPGDFHYRLYGYYDHSHFYKHLKQFLQKKTLTALQPHLTLLAGLHKQAAMKKPGG